MIRKKTISEQRDYKVVKSNELIQQSRFNLSVQEQKIILFLISKIKPEDVELKEYIFEIKDFCKVCGLDAENGANYKYIKQTLKNLRDKSIWITLSNGSETTLAWIDKVTMQPNSGAVTIKIDDLMKPYLLELQKNFTQYGLIYILGMKSQYSIRIYELLKSYENIHIKIFDIDELKRTLSCENYARFPDFKRYVLDIALREINTLTDIIIEVIPIKEGKKFTQIKFVIKSRKEITERLKTFAEIEKLLDKT